MKSHIKLYEEFKTEDKSQFFKTRKEVAEFLKDIGLKPFKPEMGGYVINKDLTVDVFNCSVVIEDEDFEWNGDRLPVQFGNVGLHPKYEDDTDECDFTINRCGLVSLKGTPREVRGTFDCSNNWLTDLKDCPEYAMWFDCSGNRLKTLDGAENLVTSSFNCSDNEDLQSLVGGPKKLEGDPHYICRNCDLRSLEGICQTSLQNFDCSENKWLSTLKYIPYVSEDITARDCGLITLYHVKETGSGIYYSGNPCTEGYDKNGGYEDNDKEIHAKALTEPYGEDIDSWRKEQYDKDKADFLEELAEEDVETFIDFVLINSDILELPGCEGLVGGQVKNKMEEIYKKDAHEFYRMFDKHPRILKIFNPENDDVLKTLEKVKDVEKGYF